MEELRKNQIYSRLMAIDFKIDSKVIPDPGYINRKISECHMFIGEVEKFFLQVSQELALSERALNNARGKYESDKERLLTNDESIRTLPNIRDREARANSQLRDVLNDIQNYKNEVSDLTILQKAIALKSRNLMMGNNSIKSQIRTLESQVKLGAPAVTDSVVQSFMEEMKKGISGEDSFKDVSSSAEDQVAVDPTQPLNVDELLSDSDSPTKDDPVESEPEEEEDKVQDEPDWEGNNLSKEAIAEASKDTAPKQIVDLDSVLGDIPVGQTELCETVEELSNFVTEATGTKPGPEVGGAEKEDWLKTLQDENKKGPKSEKVEAEKPETKSPEAKKSEQSGMNLDDLLKQWA